jgi:hypothetical protein
MTLAANAIVLPMSGWLITRLGRRNYFLLSSQRRARCSDIRCVVQRRTSGARSSTILGFSVMDEV